MTDILDRMPNAVLAERLPPMTPEDRARLLAQAKAEVLKLLLERSKAMGARERAERKKLRGQNALAHGIAKAELRIHRRLLALMETTLKAEHGEKSWRASQLLRQSALYRRLKGGRGMRGALPVSGSTPGERAQEPAPHRSLTRAPSATRSLG